jgi:hypothetical protein
MQYTLETYLYSHCNIHMKHMKHASKIAKTFGASRREGGGGGCLAGAERRGHRDSRRRGGGATPDLVLKHLDETFATYI